MRFLTAHDYGCVMIELPEALAEEVRALAFSIPEVDIHHASDGDGDVPDRIHVTVRYGLKCSLEEVQETVEGFGLGEAGLTGLSSFHHDDCAVLKVGVRSESLEKLNRKLAVLPHIDTYPIYKPHITVAYLKHRKNDPYWYREFREKHSWRFEGRSFSFDRVLFSEPSGEKTWIDLWKPNIDYGRLLEMGKRVAVAEIVEMKKMRCRHAIQV